MHHAVIAWVLFVTSCALLSTKSLHRPNINHFFVNSCTCQCLVLYIWSLSDKCKLIDCQLIANLLPGWMSDEDGGDHAVLWWQTLGYNFFVKKKKKREKKGKKNDHEKWMIPISKITVQGNDYWFGQIWILCDAGVWHTRIFECSPIEWHSASSVFRTSPSESFTKIVRKYQTQKRTVWFYTFS